MPDETNQLPTWLEIDLDALLHNIGAVRRALGEGVRLLLTVKADAYGHGATQVAGAAGDVDMLGVATVHEAIELAESGIEKPVLILSPILATEIPIALERGFSITISSLEFARAVAQCAERLGCVADVHVEVDTGMGRTGFLAEDAGPLMRDLAAMKGLRVVGLYTHFPVSDTDTAFTREQIAEFLKVVATFEQSPLLHAANSAGIANVRESHFQMVRPGLAIYGYEAAGGTAAFGVRPIMSWKCRLVQIRQLPAGTPVSYGRTFVTRRPTAMGVLPVGYGHGYPFRLSNRGAVLLKGGRAPIIGRVTMDMTMVDLTELEPKPVVGDEVTLIGRRGKLSVTADDLADWAGTIPYEVLTGVSKRVSRLYISDGKVVTLKTPLGVRHTNKT
jgi:alanine racemase